MNGNGENILDVPGLLEGSLLQNLDHGVPLSQVRLQSFHLNQKIIILILVLEGSVSYECSMFSK